MSQWQQGDGFRAASSPQTQELLQGWTNKEEENSRTSQELWAAPHASSFHYDANQYAYLGRQNSAGEAPLHARFESRKDELPLAARLEISNDRAENHILRNEGKDAAQAGKDNQNVTPLSRIYDILDVQSASSRWLEQRGYLDSFKSPNCTLDLTFGTDARGSKVGAVMTAPDGTKRTMVACEGGATFQRLTASDGRELVKFLSSGQIVELKA